MRAKLLGSTHVGLTPIYRTDKGELGLASESKTLVLLHLSKSCFPVI